MIRLYAVLAALCAVLAVGFWGGWKAHEPAVKRAEQKLAKAEAEFATAKAVAEKAKAEAEAGAAEAINRANAQAAKAVEVVKWRTQEVVREVKVLVPVSLDSTYPISDGLVCAHDAAVASCNGDPAPGPCATPDAPSEVGASALAVTITENYGACAEYRARCLAWESFYNDLRANWNGKVTGGTSP